MFNVILPGKCLGCVHFVSPVKCGARCPNCLAGVRLTCPVKPRCWEGASLSRPPFGSARRRAVCKGRGLTGFTVSEHFCNYSLRNMRIKEDGLTNNSQGESPPKAEGVKK